MRIQANRTFIIQWPNLKRRRSGQFEFEANYKHFITLLSILLLTSEAILVISGLVPLKSAKSSHQGEQLQAHLLAGDISNDLVALESSAPADVVMAMKPLLVEEQLAAPIGAHLNQSAPMKAAVQPVQLVQPAQVANHSALLEPAQQKKIDKNQAPKSDKQQVLQMFGKFFLKARSHDDHQQKEFVRDGVILRLRELGFETSFLQKSRFEFRRRPATSYNMISILPGKYRQTKRDRIVLVGAHWDSATKAPGVDDNGSGSTCLLEIARLISENRCSFEHTVMLVWFDYEEQGKYGSEFFVNDYLFPLELEKYGSQFIGAYILDMILVRDKENYSQTLPLNLKTRLKDFTEELEREKNCGDFLATWSRKSWDEPLEGAFRSAWIDLGYESRTFKAMRPVLPQTQMPNADERYEWKDFFRSDHASFWFPPLTSSTVRRAPNRTSSVNHTSLNAILLTDLGPWRKSYQRCYHAECDDEHLLTDGNVSFMQQVIDSLVLTLMRVGHGECANLAAPQPTATPPTPDNPITASQMDSTQTQAPTQTLNCTSSNPQANGAARGCISSAQAH